MADGNELRALSQGLEAKKISELNEKYFNLESSQAIGNNKRGVIQARTLGTVWIGMAAGIFNLESVNGILFYFLADLVFSLCVALRYGFRATPYF